MDYKGYFLVTEDGAVLVPGQFENEEEKHKAFFKIAIPDKIVSLNSATGGQFLIENLIGSTLFATVNFEDKEIKIVHKNLGTNYFVTEAEIEKVKAENKFIDPQKEVIARGTFAPLPDNLFMPTLLWEMLLTTIEIGKYPLILGPKGSGKTLAARELAKAMGYNFYPINAGAIFKPKQSLIGTVMAKEGTTYLIESEFLKAFTSNEPTVIFVDELSRIPTGAANYLLTATDRLQNYLYVEDKGVRVFKGKDVIFIGAANFGFEYTDTRTLDGAFSDRFIKFSMQYLSPSEELKLVMQTTKGVEGLEEDVKELIKRVNLCRKSYETLGGVSVSTRQVLDMSEYLAKGFTLYEIIEQIFKNLFANGTEDYSETIDKMFNGIA